jgi:BirA family transcriptional regulator, biotin operon repressor / biotin---[acetyl-CoA-carboxylase] ligase
MFDLISIEAALAGSIYSGKLHYAATTGSTNNDAKAAAAADAPHGSVFFADEQTAGRGRGDHTWLSAAGEGLYVSVLLRLKIELERVTLLPLVAGLAGAEAIREAAGLGADIRWPNDLLVGERKTGGILVESQIERDALAYAVVGIGINVHQREFPTGLDTPATSLDLEAGRRIAREALLVALLKSLERGANGLLEPLASLAIPERVRRSSSWISGRQVEVHGPQACTGVTEGLDAQGFLRVRTPAGLVIIKTGGLRAFRSH